MTSDVIAVIGDITHTADRTDGAKVCTVIFPADAWHALHTGMIRANSLRVVVCPLKNTADEAKSDRAKRRASLILRDAELWRHREWCAALGTDADFQAYAKRWGCCEAGRSPSPCVGDVVYAHVRRVHRGSGTGIKPRFSGVGLCDFHHRQQHQHGESALTMDMEEQADHLLKAWCNLQLSMLFRAPTLRDINPRELMEWATAVSIDYLIPREYRVIADTLP
jgi:hypothetical protein